MRKGTIFKNLWAGYDCYFIYQNPGKIAKREERKSNGYVLHNAHGKWEIRQGSFYTRDLKDGEHFPVVGNIDIDELIINATLRQLEDTGHIGGNKC